MATRRAQQRNNRTAQRQRNKRIRHTTATAAAASPKLTVGRQPNDSNASPAEAASTVDPIYEYSAEQNAATQADLQRRQAVLAEACARHGWVGQRTPNAWEFFLSPGHGLAWCNVFKAASSTWLYYFNILGE